LEPWLLSGDHAGPAEWIAAKVGVDASHCVAAASPEVKRQVVQAHPGAIMVGDGANDAIALAAADVGIAAHGGMEISLRAADVFLGSPGVASVHEMIVVARETIHVVRRNLALSLVYNLVAAGFAFAGKIDPLLAAILMPASALTVFISSVAGTRRLRRAFRELSA
jgi:Cu2+-exporting ATPase